MRLREKARRLAVALIVMCAAIMLLCGVARADGLTVHFLDIGRNDGILIECDGAAAFIDGGAYPFSHSALEYMQARGIQRLDYYIGTHAHKDHVSGAAGIIAALSPAYVLQPHDGVREIIAEGARGEAEKAAARNVGYITVAPGQTYSIGGARLTILGPIKVTRYKTYTTLENGNSLICRLTYGERTFLLTGDAMAGSMFAVEEASPGALKCDVLKNPHHNGNTKPEILAFCAPQYVVYSTEDAHLPSGAALRNVAGLGARALITSPRQNSTVLFHTDGHELVCVPAAGPSVIRLARTELSLYEGKTGSVGAQQTPAHYRTLLYVSEDPSVASVDATGHVTAHAPGTTVIRALASNGLSAECAVTVSPVTISLSSANVTIQQHSARQLRYTPLPRDARIKSVTWSSDDPSIAAVDAKGKITGMTPGETTIRATLPNGSQAVCAVAITPVPVSSVKISPRGAIMTIWQTKQMTAAVSPKNATDQSVSWSSEDESVVRVDQNGLVRAVGVGRAKITVTAAGGRSHAVTMTVRPVYISSIAIVSDRDTLVEGVPGKNTLSLTASIQPRDATIQEVVWKSANTRVATVDERGVVTGVGRGRTMIYAISQDGSNRRGTFRVTVEPNQFARRAALLQPGCLTVSAQQMSYERDYLKIALFYANQTDEAVPFPSGGVLTLILPDGRRLPVMPVEPGQRALRRGGVGTVTFRAPLANCPQLAGLDLAACDATVTE